MYTVGQHHGVHAQYQAHGGGFTPVDHPTQRHAAAQTKESCQGDGLAHTDAAQQKPTDDGACDVDHRHGRQYPAQLQTCQVQHLDEDERGTGQVGEQCAIGCQRQQSKCAKRGVAQHLAPNAQHGGQVHGIRVAGGDGFFETPSHQAHGEQGIGHHRHHRHSPTPVLAEKAAQGRAGTSHQSQTRHGFGHDFGAVQRGVQVAHHRTGAGNYRTHGSALQYPPSHQHLDAGAEHTAHCRHGVGHQAGEHDGATPHFVRERSPKELRDAKRQQQAAEGVLHHAHAGLQVQRQARQTR